MEQVDGMVEYANSDIIKQIQTEAWNEAIDEAAENAYLRDICADDGHWVSRQEINLKTKEMTPSPKYSYIFSKKDYVGEKLNSHKFRYHQYLICNGDNVCRKNDIAKLPIHIIKETEGKESIYNQLGNSELKLLLPDPNQGYKNELPRKNKRGNNIGK